MLGVVAVELLTIETRASVLASVIEKAVSDIRSSRDPISRVKKVRDLDDLIKVWQIHIKGNLGKKSEFLYQDRRYTNLICLSGDGATDNPGKD